MPTLARRTIALAALAIAIIAAAVALDLPSAAAQSDDEQTGRIVARRLADGRTEFGWQPTGGERILPRQRSFPANVRHDRWLRSSPVEVAGKEIGWINARRLADGRIEFAFTPTDGERIAPPARYFPVDARVGRWLRSTEIAIGPPTPATGFIAVSAGDSHNCAIRVSGAIECWGIDRYGQTSAPAGSDFIAVAAGFDHTCALRESGELACWGSNQDWQLIRTGQAEPPTGRFTAVSTGGWHNCVIRESGEIECWGANHVYAIPQDGEPEAIPTGQTNAPAGPFSAVSAGNNHTCGLRTNGEIECWGYNSSGQSDAPAGRFTAVAAGWLHNCAIRESGEIECWGSNEYGLSDAPAGRFTAVAAGSLHTCAIRTNGEIACWGENAQGLMSNTPAGPFSAVSAGYSHNCAIRTSGEIECWGDNDSGQTDAPAP